MLNEGILAVHPHLMWWFVALIVALLSLDLFVLRRDDKVMSFKTATLWSLMWVGIALTFNGWIAWYLGMQAATTFFTGYLIEMSLSVDNLFVFILIFSSFKIRPEFQHRVLYWGILGALVMRAICIGAGVAALQKFEWLEFVFAAILVWAGLKSFWAQDHSDTDPSTGKFAIFLRRFIPIKDDYVGDRFFIREAGQLVATPLFLVLILVEASDVIFAVDSIPAVLAITQDPFLVYSSNIFAILGLRNLYFVLASMVHLFRFLGTGVSFILVFIGVKMGLSHWFHIPIHWTLGVIVTMIVGSIVLSLMFPAPKEDPLT